MNIEIVALVTSLVAMTIVAAALIWSIVKPSRRIWPPKTTNRLTHFCVWAPTALVFGAGLVLGLSAWNAFELPWGLRWGFGMPLVVISHIAVWREAFNLGIKVTSGAEGRLKTDGLYRWSRNPQYVANMLMAVGWALLSASPYTAILGAGVFGVFGVFALAAFAEEPWLREQYGQEYDAYQSRMARFLSFGEPQSQLHIPVQSDH